MGAARSLRPPSALCPHTVATVIGLLASCDGASGAPAHPVGAGVGRGDGDTPAQPVPTGSCRCSVCRATSCSTCGRYLTGTWPRPSRPCRRRRRRRRLSGLAFECLVLTAARSARVGLATWDEMDTAGRVWTIPAMRMKAKREHCVPLCGRALEILDAARALGDGGAPCSDAERVADLPFHAAEDAPVPHDRRCRPRLPLVVPGLGDGNDGPSARGHRDGVRSRRPQQGAGRGRTCSSLGGGSWTIGAVYLGAAPGG